jgi:DNA-binding response OmpR family regulator
MNAGVFESSSADGGRPGSARRSVTASVLVVTQRSATDSFQRHFEAFSAYVRTAGFGSPAMLVALESPPDLIFIDSRTSAIDAIQLCRSFRSVEETSRLGIVVVAPAASGNESLGFLEAGADECWTDAVESREFELRLKGILRRFESSRNLHVLRYADLELDLERYKVRRNGKLINVTPMQFRLLRHLMENPTVVFSRKTLLGEVWQGQQLDEGAVTACVVRLRRLLNAGGGSNLIKNIPAAGYVLDCEMSAADELRSAAV